MPKIIISHFYTQFHVFSYEKETFLSLDKDFFRNTCGVSIFLLEHDDEVSFKNFTSFLEDFYGVKFIIEKEPFNLLNWKEKKLKEKNIDHLLEDLFSNLSV
jgi:hypothetical protein